MNPMTGEIVAHLNQLELEKRSAFVPLPQQLAAAAARKLAGYERAMVDISGVDELANFARDQRAQAMSEAEREYKTEKPTGKAAQRRLRQMAKAQP